MKKPLGEEMEVLRQYDEILFNQIEKKILDLETTNQQLRISLEEHQLQFENISDVVFMIGTDFNILNISPSVEKILGYKIKDFIGRPVSDLRHIFTPESFERAITHVSKMLKGEKIPATKYDFVARDGTIKHVEIHGSPLIRDGQVAGTISVARDITERLEAEFQREAALEALKESEEKYRRITENMSDMVSDVDAQGFFKYISPSHQKILGYRAEDLLGTFAFDKFHPDDKDRVTSIYMEGVISKTEQEVEYRFRHADGHYVWLRLLGHYFYDAAGEYVGSIISSRDITKRKRMEDALCESEKRYRRIAENMSDLVSDINAEGFFTYASPSHQKILGYRPEDLIGTVSFYNIHPDDRNQVWSAYAEAVTTKTDSGAEYRFRHADGHYVWLHSSGHIIFDGAGEYAGAIINSTEITERKLLEDKLRESEENYRYLYNNVPAAIYRIDFKTGKILQANDVFHEYLGFRKEEITSLSPFDLLTEESSKLFIERVEKMARGIEVPTGVEYEIFNKKGERLWMYLDNKYIYDTEGQLIAADVVAHDITERKRMEQALRESEANYRQLYNNAPAAIYRIDYKNGKFLQANDVFCEYLGYDQKEILSLSPYDVLTEKSRKLFSERLEKIALGLEVPNIVEMEVVDRKGKQSYLHLNIKNIYDAEGHVVAADVVAHDITERKRIENVLRESEERYRLLFDAVPVGIAITDMEGTMHAANRSHQEITGYTLEELVTVKIADLYVDPEQRQQMLQVLHESSQVLDYEVRFRRKDGNVRSVLLNIEQIEHDGRKLLLAAIRDITDRKQAEEALQKSEEKYRILFNNAEVGMFRTRLDGSEILDFNEKYLKTLGYTFDELKGTPSIDLWADKRERKRMAKLIKAEGKVTNFECGLLNKQGEVRTCITSLRLYRDIGILEGSIIDITERKQAEENIKTTLREKEILISEIHHRVKNNLQVISSLLGLQAKSCGNPDLTEMFIGIQGRIQSMAMIHETLYDTKDFTRIELSSYVKALSQNLFNTHNVHSGKINLAIKADGEIYVDITKAIPCGLVLNELISNALKHAFPGGKKGNLQIIINQTKNKKMNIVVRDNGVGLPDNIDIHQPQTLGLELVNGLVQNQLDGQIELRRDAGTEFWFKFPL